MEIVYEAAARRTRVTVNPESVFDQPIDLRPFEMVSLHYGMNLHAVGGQYDVTIKRLAFERLD